MDTMICLENQKKNIFQGIQQDPTILFLMQIKRNV